MEAKNKAIELVEKFRAYVDFTNDEDEFCLKSQYDRAKQCALICVDEILELLWKTHKNESEYRFYQQVKQEILNLKQ